MDQQTEQKSKEGKAIFKNPIVWVIVLFLVVGGGYWAVTSGAVDLNRFGISGFSKEFVAKVNGEGIEKRLFDLRFEQTKIQYQAQGIIFEDDDIAALRQRVLMDMINERLLIQYGKELGITASKQVVEEQYQQILSQFASEEEFEKELTPQNITLKDIQDSIAEQIIVQELIDQQVVKNNIEVSEQEMQQAYDDALAGGADIPEFEEVKLQIEESLLQQKIIEIMSAFVNQLRAEGAVEILN